MLNQLMDDTGAATPADLSFAQPTRIYWRPDDGGQRATLSEIEEYYRSLHLGRLVMQGEPGTGKTVLAIKLVRDLTTAVLNAPDGAQTFPRVPVLLNLPSFDPGDVEAPAAEVVAHALVTAGRILPVLDGLDEMDIDGTRPAGPETTPSMDRREEVQDATVVGVEPLTFQHVIDYLIYRFPTPTDRACIESRWDPIIKRLTVNRNGDPLVAALSSPLRLYLTVTTYRHDAGSPDELTRLDTADQIDDHPFARLVPAALDLRRFDFGSALRTFPIRLWSWRSFVSDGKLGCTVGFISGFLPAFLFALAKMGFVQALAVGAVFGAAFAIFFGLAGGLVSMLAAYPPAIERPVRLVKQGMVHLSAALLVGLVLGLLFWLAVGLFFANDIGFVTAGLMRLSGIAVQFRHREFQDWLTTRDQPSATTSRGERLEEHTTMTHVPD